MTVYIPTVGYPLGRPESDLKKIIKYASEARRQATTDEERDYYNQILDQAYAEKYKTLDEYEEKREKEYKLTLAQATIIKCCLRGEIAEQEYQIDMLGTSEIDQKNKEAKENTIEELRKIIVKLGG